MFEPRRGPLYPEGLRQKREREHAAAHLGTIEINATCCGSQKPESFARWRSETPDGFVFAAKGSSRYITNRRVLTEARPSIEKVFSGSVMDLNEKLGSINWPFSPTKAFDPTDFEAFLKLLPCSVEGVAIRHAVEVRHDSFRSPDFIALLQAYGVAAITAADGADQPIAAVMAPFVDARSTGTHEDEPEGDPEAGLARWVQTAWKSATGEVPVDLESVASEPAPAIAREVFLDVISGANVRNPAAAMALTRRLAKSD